MKALKLVNINEVLWFDVETVRLVEELQENTPLWDSFAYKMRNSAEFDKFGGENKTLPELYRDKAALFPEFAKICVITVGYLSEGKFKMKSYYSEDESKLLLDFAKDIQAFEKKFRNLQWCGHSVFAFDIPFIVRRMIINGVPLLDSIDQSINKPWTSNVIDIEMLWRGGAFSRASLINMAVALGLPSPKQSMNGSEVSDYYYQGKLKEISEYCERDVETSFEIYKKMAYVK